jgi:hypothetical protein
MVSVSRETLEQTHRRLEKVIRRSRLTVYEQPHAFEEFPLHALRERLNPDALALVRDDAVWSQLVPGNAVDSECFALWRFHFPADADNSGFVGWLATLLKTRFGTGVFVVCGQNSNDGGVFDYWGCPWALRAEVLAAVRQLAAPD